MRRRRRVAGFGLVDILVGVVIMLIVVLCVHRVVIASEAMRRNAQSDADAQQAAQFALARMTFDIANAGAGVIGASAALAACPVTADFSAMTRPIAVVVSDGGASDAPDSMVVRYAVSNDAVLPARFVAAAPSGAPFTLRTTMGFRLGDQLVVSDRRGACATTTVTDARIAAPGVLTVDHDIVASAMPPDAAAVDLGPAAHVVATRYDLSGGTLRTTDLHGGDAPNPLISNVVNLKIQYGIDADGDGTLDTWTPAMATADRGDWTADAVLRAAPSTLRRIKALRVGLIVRGEQFDRAATRPFAWVLFDCDSSDRRACPGRLEGAIAASARGGWHYRVYETIVPLRNVLWQRP